MKNMDQILYGAAYYDEYMPQERLEQDMQMMQKAGMNVIRIAESTWASEEPEEGVFDFSHVRRSIEAAARYGISVIVGTPTYAIPPWLAAKHPEIIALTEFGQGKYGTRQNMDITNPHYLFYAERIIRKLMECVQEYPNVIGFQLDNETKHYHVAGEAVQKRFVQYLQETFGTVEAMNQEFNFAYWSNAVDCFAHVPDVTGTINGSFFAEFEKFRRILVTEFLMWQRGIVDEYRKEEQFVTHNFDFEWRNASYGVQPDVNHYQAAKAVTLAGCDIYHVTQDALTGKEAAFCGAITRGIKQNNYLILETEAQGHIGWTPYDGQLRMQAFSHLANGADSVMYWHWHSLHNSAETYWRGLLSHDMEENRPYREAMTIGKDLQRIGAHLLHLKKNNKAAVLVSNEALTALSKAPMFPLPDGKTVYNDVVRAYADALYELNIEYDVISVDMVAEQAVSLEQYSLLVVPVLYSATEEMLQKIDSYVAQGGYLITTFKSGYSNEYLTVYHDRQPHILKDCLGISYQEYTIPVKVKLKGSIEFEEQVLALPYIRREEKSEKEYAALSGHDGDAVSVWMELVEPESAKVLASYVHPNWGKYAAITENQYGKGHAVYAGCHLTLAYTKKLLAYAADQIGIREKNLPCFPINIKNGSNQFGRSIYYYFNYSSEERVTTCLQENMQELLSGKEYKKGDEITLCPWDVKIFEE